MFPNLVKFVQATTDTKLRTELPIIGAFKRKLNNLFAKHSANIDLKAVEADVTSMASTGMEWVTILLHLLQKYGPTILDLIAELRQLFNNK